MRTSSGICAMQHPSSGMSVITSVSITKKQGWNSIRTVSYTHLDVYKRQCKYRAMILGLSRKTNDPWTKAEEKILKKYYPVEGSNVYKLSLIHILDNLRLFSAFLSGQDKVFEDALKYP